MSERLHLPRLTGYYWFSLLFLLLSPVRIEWTTFSSCEMCSDCCSTYRPKENRFFSLRVLMCVLLWLHHNLHSNAVSIFSALVSSRSSAETVRTQQTHQHQWTVTLFYPKKKTIILESTEEHLSAKASCRNEQKAPALMTPTGEKNQKHTRTIWFSLFFLFSIFDAIKRHKSKCHAGRSICWCLRFFLLFNSVFVFVAEKND